MSQPKRSRPTERGPVLAALLDKIAARQAKVGVIGQGYVGLPLAVVMAEAGFDVTGYDVLPDKVSMLNEGSSYIGDIPDARLASQISAGLYRARGSFEDLSDRDVISICVPTPLSKTRDPDISYIVDAAENVAKGLRPGQLIVLESTTYPGTTEELVLPIFDKTGLKVGVDYFLCFSPERVDPGNPQFDIRNTPRLMGGITTACLEAGATMYGEFLEQVVQMSSTQAAEMAKLLENTFRAVNIGLVNEVALMCRKLRLESWEVIDAAATKPFGFMKFYPGPGLGGHCIPVDPHYLSWILKTLNYTARFVELASEVNTSMPTYVCELVADALNEAKKPVNGSRVLLLGIAYKANVSDVRESPALDVIELLREKGADVVYHDPYVPSVRLSHGTATSEPLTDQLLASSDCVVITAAHSSIDWRRVVSLAPAIVDTRNATRGIPDPKAAIHKI
jgi:UDP-N-acetyl-D-glucosamine dehydrogenase